MINDLSRMRELYAQGLLKEALITPADVPHGWLLHCVQTDGSKIIMNVAKCRRIKVYKSLEAAHLDVRRIGFEEVTTMVKELQVA